ncbi:Glutamyl-tRNA(Gln) amidotransferase subunit A, mitochondrial [Pseudolycoriella hygida]|uniref:Glutamyl-tRNA(Gln) amidotransferase subunit A, mitochondrial n=1 Tax=Pseudolycoriella hygida TaxID=35572 RepID=A0A9Q0MTJ3_9DIPT|nr:Glutamyl-tRNA(Gln) amidotransferase subunit A, mitochondrial [Pseudolycoriella hygida]
MAKSIPSTIEKLLHKYKIRELDPCDVTNHCIDVVSRQKKLNAIIRLTPEIARSKSKESSERFRNGEVIKKLDGVPIAIKDNFCVKGEPTSCASRMLENFCPTYDATVYARLMAHGAVLIGKTNLDEFAMGSGTVDSIFGHTRNCYNENGGYISGGSSGGSAVAVASGSCFAGIGSDTGGSVRNPASYCGVVGFKPTYGLVSRHGLIPLVNSMDTPSILTRTIDDCVTVLNAIAGPDNKDSTTINRPFVDISVPNGDEISLKNVKVGIPREYHCEGLSKESLETWMKIADLLEENGAQVVDVSLPNTASSIFVYTILNQCEVASNMARYDGIEFGHRSHDEDSSTEQLYARTRQEGFNSVVKNRILSGNYYLLRRNYQTYFEKALKVRRLISNDFQNVFFRNERVSVLLTPTTLTDAPKLEEFVKRNNRDQCALQDFCTQPANMAGVPAISIPIKLSSNGLPLSVQLMGPSLSEQSLLTVAKWIENTVNFRPV